MNSTQSLPLPARDLHRGETLSMDGDRRGLRLHCLTGQLWITQVGDRIDHLLPAGREFTITQRGRVVIQALTSSASLNLLRNKPARSSFAELVERAY